MLEGFTEANFPSDMDSIISTTCYIYIFAGVVISWVSRLQKMVALSTTKSKYIDVVDACKEFIFIMRFLEELGLQQENYVLNGDSQSRFHLAKNLVFHYKKKHIDGRHHWIHEVLDDGLLKLGKIYTLENQVDIITNFFPRDK